MFPIRNEVPKQTFLFYVEDCLQGRAASASEGVESSGLREPGLGKAIMISEKRGFFVINVGHIGDCLVAEACLSVPLEAQLSPLGGFDSSLTFVPSHLLFFSFFFGKALPLGAVEVMGILARVLNLGSNEDNSLKYLDVLLRWWKWISVG